ncbi:ABC transporter ATP-binding protein [Streptomyces sp. NBC_00525]|uniref:ABC transporter ATP-binding protein n=1 Tax=Streptomyces sp. NBC_00525 TaxID=2903660 RepID=UPI002E8208D4|nr:ABC transporter ATP-binding protein [Streptomyces sp. NBC_00525]WUC92531.1 ABC transporter ATP-binding protein/permease [Streptomyces sp. NBC_00525]
MHIRDLPYPDPGDPDVRSGPRFLLWLGRNQLRGQVKALLWGLLHQCSIAGYPLAVGLAVQAVVDRSGSRLALAGALTALLGVATAVSDAMVHRSAVTNWITAAARVQQLLARKTAELGSLLTRRVAAGEVVAVSTGDVEKIGWFVESLSRFIAAATVLVVISVGLVVYLPSLGVLVAIAMPFLALSVLPLLPRATRRADVQREKGGRATELASDTVAGLRVLRGIGGEELFLKRYRRASQEVRVAAVHSARMWSLISAVQVLLPGLLLLALVVHGAALARDGKIGVGELVTVYSAVTLMLFPLRHFEEIAMAYSFSRPSAQRAVRVLGLSRTTRPATVTTAPSGDLYDPVTGLLAPQGRLTAVVCGDPDEAGRLADRLGGHALPSETGSEAGDGNADGDGDGNGDSDGTDAPPSVLLGGVALDEVERSVARAAVLVQDKDPVLLSGTLRELLDVPSSGRVAAGEALSAAQCDDVLAALAQASPDPDCEPMDTRITERGRSLSGGQRQRLALARSLLADPDVLVLDEPTSAVDSHTEARVAAGVRELRANRTTVAFSSSPLLLDLADRVALVHDGTVVAVGTHRELLRTEERYRAVVARDTDDEKEPDAAPERSEGVSTEQEVEERA